MSVNHGWAWMFRDVGTRVWQAVDTGNWDIPRICSTDDTHSSIYGYGRVSEEGELLRLGDVFNKAQDYEGYMMLMQTPYDCARQLFYFICYSGSNLTLASANKGKWNGTK